MIIGYGRISNDDYTGSKYISIENQKRIIDKYVKENGMVLDRFFEDDGWSGYSMDRPSFNEVKHLIDENLVDILIAKDLSRIGRHNANVLLFLERAKQHNVRIILVDDNYDSATDVDDMIGIKTWFNELHVTQGSRKVRNALKIMQETASLIHRVPYGYDKDPYVKNKYYINPDIAVYVKRIFELYADGNGYKKLAKILNTEGVPTPSTIWHQDRINKGLVSNVKVTPLWDSRMVKSIITNDFYIGTLRTRKFHTISINGPRKRTDKSEHYVFENAHEPIISKELFYLVQDLNEKHSEEAYYKGMRKYNNPYAGILVCGDCGRALTIAHYNKGEVISYACRNYRDKGANVCSAHSFNKKELNLIVKDYLTLCRHALQDMVESVDSILSAQIKKSTGQENRLKILTKNIEVAKSELKAVMEQKIKEMAANPSMRDIISEMYNKIQADKMTSIEIMQNQIKEYENIDKNKSDIKQNFKSAIEVFDSILKSEEFTSRQLNTIINKISVYDNNIVEIELKGELNKIFKEDKIIRMSKDDRIKRLIIDYITSVSAFGATRLLKVIRSTDSISYEKVQALVQEFIDKGYVVETENKKEAYHSPYVCVASKEDMLNGFKICTDVQLLHTYTNHSADFETIVKISTWIQRYI